jgi:hypothetical protein
MTTSPIVHDLVREGRATPKEGAILIELRRSLDERRRVVAVRKLPIYMHVFVVIGTFVLALLGIKRAH